jgi:hypothetical protein
MFCANMNGEQCFFCVQVNVAWRSCEKNVSSCEEQERRVAEMMMRCSGMRSSSLLHSLAASYAEGTGGLQCLCMWPTKYPRCVFFHEPFY